MHFWGISFIPNILEDTKDLFLTENSFNPLSWFFYNEIPPIVGSFLQKTGVDFQNHYFLCIYLEIKLTFGANMVLNKFDSLDAITSHKLTEIF